MDRDLIYRILRIRLAGIEAALVSRYSDDFVVSHKVQCMNEFWLDMLRQEGVKMFPIPEDILSRIDRINDVRRLKEVSK